MLKVLIKRIFQTICVYLWIFGIVFLCYFECLSQTVGNAIEITELSIVSQSDQNLVLVAVAHGNNGITVGSYLIRIESWPNGSKVQDFRGFKRVNNFPYVISKDYETNDGIMLKDNGLLDEDKRPGVYRMSINTKNWVNGSYEIRVDAINRPSSGSYHFDYGIVNVVVGEKHIVKAVNQQEFKGRNITIYRNKEQYACFPTLFKLPDGRLVTQFAARLNANHADRTGDNVTMVSEDNGYQWRETEEELVNPLYLANDGRLLRFRAGGLNYSPISERSKLLQEGRRVLNANKGKVAWLDQDIYIFTSHNKGKTWDKKKIPVPDDILGLVSFHVLHLKKGFWLVSLYGDRKAENAKNRTEEVFFLRSLDDGKNWEFIYHAPDSYDNPKLTLNETTTLMLPNGHILAMHRAADNSELYQSVSFNKGKSWTKPLKTNIWGYPADLLNLSNGRVLCIYGYRRPPMGIRACVSYDNGNTWDIEHELVIRNDAKAKNVGDLGYPKVIQLPNGDLFTVYYITTDRGKPYIAGTRFSLP